MKRRLSVAIVSHFPPPPGGIPGQADLLVRGLREEGLRVVVVRTNLGAGRVARRLDGMRGVRTLLRTPLFLLRLAAALPRVRIVHVLSGSGLGFFLFSVPAVLAGRVFGRRVVVNYHGGAAATFLAAWPRVVPVVLRWADVVVVPSAFLKRVFAEWGIAASVVPNACELDLPGRLPDQPMEPVFIVARHLEPVYNVACALRAFALIREAYQQARLVVLGDGPEGTRLRHLADSLGVSDAVEFTGYVPHAAVAQYYARASVLLNTSDVDNMPMAILEAFATGLPVVSTRAGGIPDLVEAGRTGLLVDLDDHQAVAREAIRLLDNPSLAASLADNARQEAERYRWPRVAVAWRQLYDATADGTS